MAVKDQLMCADCGSKQPPVMANRGSGWLEILFWFCYVLPGVIYSIWRRVRKRQVCSFCGNPSMISVHSARARKIVSLMKVKEVPKGLFKKPLGVTELKPKKRRSSSKKSSGSKKRFPSRPSK